MFEDANNFNINIDNYFLSKSSKGEYCFVENNALMPYEKWIEKLIVFRWNRNYPYDTELDIDLSKWNLEGSTEFVGSSHSKISMEVYAK